MDNITVGFSSKEGYIKCNHSIDIKQIKIDIEMIKKELADLKQPIKIINN
jgi:hypothetical protein